MHKKPTLILITFIFIINFIFSVEAPINEVKHTFGNGWYQAIGYQSLYEYSEKEGLEKAINAAQKVALQAHSGIKIQSSSTRLLQETDLNISMDKFFQISNFLSEGIITDSELIKKEIIEFESQRYIKAIIKVKVEKLKGQPDPTFKLEANLNRTIYNEGEAIRIEATTSKDCYLYVFNIAANDSVYVLLPNQVLTNNFITKSTLVKIPPDRSGISYVTSLLPDRESDQELIKVLAIKGEKLEDFDITLGKKNMALNSFYKMLLDLDRNQISEVDLVFTVNKKQ